MVIFEPDEILCEMLRSRITDPASRHTSTTDTFTATAAQTDFTLTPTSGTKVQAITGVTVDAVAKSKWADYYVDLQNQMMIYQGTLAGAETVVVTYGEGEHSWIYKDFPRITLSDSSFPRIAVQIIGGTGTRLGQYTADMETEIRFQIDAFAVNPKSSTGTHIYTINDKNYGGADLAKILLYKVFDALKDYEDDLHPLMYQFEIISTPHAVGWEERSQTFRYMAEISLKMLNVGDSL